MKKITYIAIKSDDTDFRIINSKLFKDEFTPDESDNPVFIKDSDRT